MGSPFETERAVLAQLPGQDDAPPSGEGAETTVPGQESVESLAEFLAGRVDNEFLSGLIESFLGPALQILFVVVLAATVVTVAKRVIRRLVERAKDPSAPRGRRLRGKVGLLPDQEDAAEFSLRRAQRADALGAMASSVVSAVVWFIAMMMILAAVGLDLAPVIAGAGVLGLAIGFGAQDVVKDLLSGMFMLAEDQFGVGDIIDAGEATGVVEGVTLRTTRIRDVHGTLWHVPNGEIRRVGNSSQQWARSLLDIAVSYETDVDVAISLIERVANAMAEEEDYRDLFLDDPEVWGVQALGADSVDIRLVIKTVPAKQYAVSRELRRRIKASFDAADVEIPFPQRTVWLRTEQPLSLGGVEDARSRRNGEQPDESRMAAAIASAAQGDRGRKVVESQDHVAVAEDVEEEQAAAADAVAAEDDDR